MRAAEEPAVGLHAVAEDAAAAVTAFGCQCVDRALETVEHVSSAIGRRDLERLVVLVSTNLAGIHAGCHAQALALDLRVRAALRAAADLCEALRRRDAACA